jgi:cardiolipin synthase
MIGGINISELEWLAMLVFLAHTALALTAAGHALLTVHDPRAAWGWIAVCWLAPLAGPLLYALLGTNRVKTRARQLRRPLTRYDAERTPPGLVPELADVHRDELRELVRIGGATSHRALEAGHRLSLLHNGEQAYPAMLEAIGQAQRRVWMSTYIFARGSSGTAFADALADAQARGVDVRVLIDAVGDLYYWPRGSSLLRGRGLIVRRFQLPRRFLPFPHFNLRNHRKLLIVDEHLAFAGGINIGDHHCLRRSAHPTQDLHVRFEGPVAQQLADVFREDWAASGGQLLADPPTPAITAATDGPGYCRAITEGPSEDFYHLELVMLGALANAHQRVAIMTPYLIPTPELSRGLEAAALRGVEVCIILPERSNLPWVDWAARRWLRGLLAQRVRVFLQPAPFAHSKMLLIDDYYSHVGSANLDPRSLRLNFEVVVETYCRQFASVLGQHFNDVLQRSRPLRTEELDRAGAAVRIRDAVCWLFSPYL